VLNDFAFSQNVADFGGRWRRNFLASPPNPQVPWLGWEADPDSAPL
jgi:hypothetical protein